MAKKNKSQDQLANQAANIQNQKELTSVQFSNSFLKRMQRFEEEYSRMSLSQRLIREATDPLFKSSLKQYQEHQKDLAAVVKEHAARVMAEEQKITSLITSALS